MNKTTIKLVLVALIWGGTFIAGRIAAPFLPPLTSAALRFSFAAICFLIWLATNIKSLRIPTPKVIFYTALMGLTGIAAYNLCFFEGLKNIPASRAALVIATNPICASLAAHFLLNEKLTAKSFIGVFLSLCGAILVITQGHLEVLWNGGVGIGEIVIFGCVLSWVTYTIISKKVMGELSPMIASTYSTLFGALVLVSFALSKNNISDLGALPLNAWLALAYLGIFGTFIAFKWYLDGVNALGPAKASLFINLVPVSAVFFGITMLGESMNIASLIGGVLVIIGIIITLYFKNNASKPS